MKFLLLVLIFALAACSHAPSLEKPKVQHAWAELGPEGRRIVRVVASGACPAIEVNGAPKPMSLRTSLSPEFPLPICEAEIPADANAKVGTQSLPPLVANPHRILLLGDTGCRVEVKKDGHLVSQDCNDPAHWPLSTIASTAAKWHPELVIHVGDYHYRESDCPADRPECAGTISGDRWASWEQDFFTPARPLLEAAPWIFVRGNHETCKRAGQGWYHLLDVHPFATCTDTTDPYGMNFGHHRFEVLDSAEAENLGPSLGKVGPGKDPLWLFTHRPFLTPGGDDEVDPARIPKLPAALAKPGVVAAVFTGHRHVLSLNRFSDDRPPELITGNGGDLLQEAPQKSKGVKSTTFRAFGFLTLELRAGESWWTVEEHDRNGMLIESCRLQDRSGKVSKLSCKDAQK